MDEIRVGGDVHAVVSMSSPVLATTTRSGSGLVEQAAGELRAARPAREHVDGRRRTAVVREVGEAARQAWVL